VQALAFRLEERPGIRGRVVFPEGERASDVGVRGLRLGPEQQADPALLATGDPNDADVDEDGTFSLTDLVPGRWLVGVVRGHRGGALDSQVVDVGKGVSVVELRVPALRPEEYVAVRAFGPDGSLLTDPRFGTGYASESAMSSGSSVVIERPDGSHWVLHHPPNGTEPDAKNWIEVTSAGHGTLRHEYPAGRGGSVDLRFAVPARVEVEVTGLRGTRYEGRIQVSLEYPTTGRFGGGPAARPADDTGTFAVPSVQPGAFEVVLRLGSGRVSRSHDVNRQPVQVAPGLNRVTVALPELHAVTIEGAVGGAWLRRISAEGVRVHSAHLQAGADGRAVGDGLPAGEYEARSGSRRATFRLPGASVVRLVE
jgi:hypothetical protein